MNFSRLWTIARLELLQRVRTASWYVLLGIFAAVLVGVTALAFLSFGMLSGQGGPGVYSTVVYITLLLVVLVSPTLSGNSINGDRDAATLAPVQVTLATTGEILLGKFLAAWITGLAFAVVALPFLVIATLTGGVQASTVAVSLAVLIVETGVIAAIGVALSGILARPLFSVAATYLVVAALTIGSLIGFGLVGASITTEVESRYRSVEYGADGPLCREGVETCWESPEDMVCGEWQVDTYRVGRFDTVWWMLAANPFIILADATPTRFDAYGNPEDAFGYVKVGVRQAQLPPDPVVEFDECTSQASPSSDTPAQIVATTVPSWFVGLGVQLLLAAGLLSWAYGRTRTPARALPPGTRIA